MKQDNFEIDSLDYEINSQELNGKSAAGWSTAVRLGSLWLVVYTFL